MWAAPSGKVKLLLRRGIGAAAAQLERLRGRGTGWITTRNKQSFGDDVIGYTNE